MDDWLKMFSEWLAPFAALALVVLVLSLVSLGLLLAALVMPRLGGRRQKVRRPGSSPSEAEDAARGEAPAEAPRVTRPVTQVEQVFHDEPLRPSPGRVRWTRWLAGLSLLTLLSAAGLLVAVWYLNAYRFEPTVRWIANRLQAASEAEVQFASATGDLWTGRIELRSVAVRRDSGPRTYDLTADRLILDVDTFSLLGLPAFESVQIEGLRGRIALDAERQARTAPRAFTIRRFELRDAELQVDGGQRHGVSLSTPLTVRQWTTAPLRSEWLAHDLLFRTNAAGLMRGVAFSAESKTDREQRWCRWQMSDMPLDLAAYGFGPPFSWLTQGRLDLSFREQASPPDSPRLDLRCRIVFREVDVEPPADLPLGAQLLVAPVVGWIRSHREEIPLEFPVRMDMHEFANKVTLFGAGFDYALSDAVLAELAARAGVEPGLLQQDSQDLVRKLQRLLGER